MRPFYFLFIAGALLATSLSFAADKTSHGFSLYGDLKYATDFKHLNYVNPNAPKGGQITLMGFGTFDTLNPYTLKGTSPANSPGLYMYGLTELNESLLVGTGEYSPSGDEPQSAYGLIAESLTYPDDYSWVVFHLRPYARFHDGQPITPEDVVYSYQTLLKEGHPRFQQQLRGVESVDITGPLDIQVKFKHAQAKADILRFGEIPILPKHYWQSRDFSKTTLEPPLLSGPYKIAKVDPGKTIVLQRVDDYWGAKLAINKGRFNFNKITIQFYRDQTIAFEAFKAGNFDIFYDYTAKNWATGYDFPAIKNGKVVKREIRHQIPSGTQGFFFNTRRLLFQDVRVRQALSLMFDFEWTNKTLFNGAYKRNTSYYPNSPFQAEGIPSGEEEQLLRQYADQLPPHLFDRPFTQPVNTGNGNIRPQIKKAIKLMKQAGWSMDQGQLKNAKGQAFQFEILIRQPGIARVVMPFIKNLQRIGIQATTRLVDATQYKVRLDDFDYDMTTFVLSQGLSPSYEQRDYYHSSSRNIKGSQNYAGIQNPVIDQLLERVLDSPNRQQLIIAMKALDRVLLWNHYIIPNWHLDYHRIAYWDKFGIPKHQPPYKLGVENWWMKTR